MSIRMDRLNDEVFPNNELTARAQIRITNKKIDEQIKVIEEKLKCLDQQNLDLNDIYNINLTNHNKRFLKDLEHEILLMKTSAL